MAVVIVITVIAGITVTL